MGILSTVLSRINERSALRKIIANTSWLLVDKFLSLVAGFLVGAWVARYLGPAQYGFLNYALAFESLFVPIAGLGLASIVVREIVRAPDDKNTILGTTFVLQFAAGLLTFMLIIGASYLLRPDDVLMRWLMAIVAGQLVFRAFSNTVDYWFQSQIQSKYVVWSQNIALVLIASIKLALILVEAPLIAFAWVVLAQVVFLTAAAAVFYHISGQTVKVWRASVHYAKHLLKDSWPLIISGLSVAIYMRIGQLMVGYMMGDEDLGIYSTAVTLSELWYFIPMAVATSVFPNIVRSRESQTEQGYRKRLQTFYDVMAGIAYIIMIPCALFASPLITLLYGPEYVDAGPILTVHIWAFIFVSLGVARGKWLIAENMTRFSMFATILGAIASIGLNCLLIPRYGGLGAAWATLASQAIAAYFSCVLLKGYWYVWGQLSLSLLIPFRLVLGKRDKDFLSKI
ncbi:MAG TPA: flippase [Chloroflexi bacterium]|nr:flippase [Chloroflexota bacterium]